MARGAASSARSSISSAHAKAGGSPGGNSTSMGGNLGGASGAAISATGSASKQVVPQANSSVEQMGNTMQQALPSIISQTGGSGIFLIPAIKNIYDDIIDTSRRYYEDFADYANYWRSYYMPFLRDIYSPTAFQTLVYTGTGRGVANSDRDPDKDLFRRGQLAGQNIKVLDIAWRTKRRVVSQYGHGEMRMDDIDISFQHMRAQIDNQLSARRIEDVYEDEFNNRRWARLIQATNIGLTGSNIASAGYSSAMAAHTEGLQGMANYKTAMGNQIAAAAGNFVQHFTSDGDGE